MIEQISARADQHPTRFVLNMTTLRRYFPLAATLLVVAALVALRLFDPATSGIFPPCPVRYLTGWYCPGCGSLRAIHQLLEGNFRAAWALNPLAVMLLPFVSYGLASQAFFYLRGRRLPEIFLPANAIRALCVVVILFAVARNLPMRPFSLLAPGGSNAGVAASLRR